MVAELSPFLSDATPGLARRAKLGDHPRGQPVFSPVPFEALSDFRSALAILAEPAGEGRFIPWATAVIDAAGRLRPTDRSWPTAAPRGSVAFVHFLVESDEIDQESMEDLLAEAVPVELSLAA
jgi:hypothetical protein